ncbi:penicillin-binding transpeptidase domain-containing protein [Atopobacter phocae]|uniref:penicillin-binding transpeptidase domain-containing protein n=1 Tax=Atopobacter phocae TaxID=136492 RepID=UPI000470566D|nr:penicillin-binding transpeptidase domain-containing protein [Atopobacter phocae]
MKINERMKRQLIIFVLSIISLVFFVVVWLNFSVVMITGMYKEVNLRKESDSISTRVESIHARRGEIVDRANELIAVEQTTYRITATLTDEWAIRGMEPNYVTDKKGVAQALSSVLKIEYDEVMKRLNQDKQQVEFGIAGRNITPVQKKQIEKFKLHGLTFTPKTSRLYPNGIFSSHLIGYTTEDEKTPDHLIGQMGIESLFDKALSGEDGKSVGQAYGNNKIIPQSAQITQKSHDGQIVQLTLDTALQQYLEELMNQVNKKYEPKSMQAILVNAKTGAILANSQRPTFDPNTLIGIEDNWQQLLVQQTYEPGSTMKVLSLAAAIDQGIFQPDKQYESGSLKVYDKTVHDWNKSGWGRISYLEGVAHSSNVLFVQLAKELGSAKWKNYLDQFGISQLTNSGFSSEQPGANPYSNPFQQLTTSFGQGISVTSIQMLQAFTAIANQGQMKPIHFLKEIRTQQGKVIKEENLKTIRQPISEKAATKTLEYLTEVVNNPEGTGHVFKSDHLSLAVKTGTSEMVDPETGTYYRDGDNYLYSVVGFAPAEDPEFILYVLLEKPTTNPTGVTGTQMLSEVFNPMIERAINSKTSHVDSVTTNDMPFIVGQTVEFVKKQLNEEVQPNLVVIGNGDSIIRQYPEEGAPIMPGRPVILMTSEEAIMPNLQGWARQDVEGLASLLKVDIKQTGVGHVVSQNVKPGVPIDPTITWKIKYQLKDNE